MAQAEPRSITRRALVGAFVAVGITAPIIAVASEPDGADNQFLHWEAEINRLEAEAQLIDDTDITDRIFDHVGDLEHLILETSSSSRTAAEVKLRALLRYFGTYDARCVAPIRDVMTYVANVPL
ncbi:Uncharacterised protein [Brevundimonas diminuta]|uniref:hypothetical protein n=1 Tax=Brevundimonas diminuta TaxID=293 RepID=UPI0002D4A13D|nr:hypothetical protein [Brevundimonas diminuta]OWR21727.1 hypothetical protein CD944_04715 [Brevundimonas diminuta]WQE46595.1 hypothetical protein U0020_07055 [Brevundimonas diminuta]SPU47946.1 Uncharacterised protein [Brevundimonas diminuta]SUW15850.1 Uncharacterised protein [Brevundimonas diminuta]